MLRQISILALFLVLTIVCAATITQVGVVLFGWTTLTWQYWVIIMPTCMYVGWLFGGQAYRRAFYGQE